MKLAEFVKGMRHMRKFITRITRTYRKRRIILKQICYEGTLHSYFSGYWVLAGSYKQKNDLFTLKLGNFLITKANILFPLTAKHSAIGQSDRYRIFSYLIRTLLQFQRDKKNQMPIRIAVESLMLEK
jgi:hypothetical protein